MCELEAPNVDTILLHITILLNDSFYVWFMQQLCEASGSSLGYGFNRMVASKSKSQSSDSLDDNQVSEGTLAI